MLTVTKLGDGEYLIESVALGVEEYYLGLGEAPGVWTGRWAAKLGLEGVVEADDLRCLLDRRHPVTGVELAPRQKPTTVKAIDLTFSAPKSASVLWAVGGDASRVVMAAHVEAVEAALGFLEGKASVARRQVSGVRGLVATSGLAVAGFVHRTSREGDPQLHTHCLAVNLTERIDGRVVALDGRPLFVWARAAGSVYQAELQRALAARLGVLWGPDRNGTREIDGFARGQLRVFSKRTVQIEGELQAVGADGLADPGVRARADDLASLATRAAKDRGLTPARLAERWDTEAGEAGLAVGRALEERVCFREGQPGPLLWEEIAGALVDGEAGVSGHNPRFTEADVVEHVCALSAGRLTVPEIEGHVARFLGSNLVVRLTPGIDGGHGLAEWSTVAHRRLEDRVLGLVDALASAELDPISPVAVAAAVGERPWLGSDQQEAVRTLTGPGGAVRCVAAPAGFGKTAMVATAAQAAAAVGRPVLGTATTGKGVAELDGAGVPGVTVARLRHQLATDGPLAAGTVVILDEVSQCSTRDAETVLAAVTVCPDGQLWVLGDARQAQSVLAGGLADDLEYRGAQGLVPFVSLEVNRRQVNPDDRDALTLLRTGRAEASQAIRADHGWEHTGASPEATRDALAAAASDDIGRHGVERVAVLCVSHVDAEDLADRIRRYLTDLGSIHGPGVEGPGWAGPRTYQAGDQVLFHTRCGPRSHGVINGTTGTVVTAAPEGLDVRVDGRDESVRVDAGFVAGSRVDGSPNLSHAWARTVDGSQGGTWEAAHLLGTPALDQYRGYVGQSRSRQPTHTWNTVPVRHADHGGRLADDRPPGEAVMVALGRMPDRSMAARSDPHPLDRSIRASIENHLQVWRDRPPDRTADLARAFGALRRAEDNHAASVAYLDGCRHRRSHLGPLAGLRARGRGERADLDRDLAEATAREQRACDVVGDARADVASLTSQQAESERFVAAQEWRRSEVHRLRQELLEHWTTAIVACVRAGDPLAYGTDRLRQAAHHRQDQLSDLDASVPPDRSGEVDRTARTLNEAVNQRRQAAARLVTARAGLEGARRPERAAAAATVESKLRELRTRTDNEQALRASIDRLADQQRQRSAILAEQQPTRGPLLVENGLLSRALDDTLAERVIALAAAPPQHLRAQLGLVPANDAGRAVWCHHAARHEAGLDCRSRTGVRFPGLDSLRPEPRQEILIAASTGPDVPRSDTVEAWAGVAAEIRPLANGRSLTLEDQARLADLRQAHEPDLSPDL